MIIPNASIPSADKAVKIAQALGVTVEYLVTGINSDKDIIPVNEPEIRKLLQSIKKLPKNKKQIVLQNAQNLAGILLQQK